MIICVIYIFAILLGDLRPFCSVQENDNRFCIILSSPCRIIMFKCVDIIHLTLNFMFILTASVICSFSCFWSHSTSSILSSITHIRSPECMHVQRYLHLHAFIDYLTLFVNTCSSVRLFGMMISTAKHLLLWLDNVTANFKYLIMMTALIW